MARFPPPVTMITCSIPLAIASSTPYWIVGLSTSGSISLGCALVTGKNRVPSPAAGKIALRTEGSVMSGGLGERFGGLGAQMLGATEHAKERIGHARLSARRRRQRRWAPQTPKIRRGSPRMMLSSLGTIYRMDTA